jgi:hypothetical protein
MTTPRKIWYVGKIKEGENISGMDADSPAPSLSDLAGYEPDEDEVRYLSYRSPRHWLSLGILIGVLLAFLCALLTGCSWTVSHTVGEYWEKHDKNPAPVAKPSAVIQPKMISIAWDAPDNLDSRTFYICSSNAPGLFTNGPARSGVTWGGNVPLVDNARLLDFTNWPCIAIIHGTNRFSCPKTNTQQFFAVRDEFGRWATGPGTPNSDSASP